MFEARCVYCLHADHYSCCLENEKTTAVNFEPCDAAKNERQRRRLAAAAAAAAVAVVASGCANMIF